MKKLWMIEVFIDGEPDGQGWSYPAGTANVAISRILRYHYLNKKAGQIRFRQATKEELARYLKSKGKDKL